MDLNQIKNPKCSLVIAKRGGGKTTLVRNILKKVPRWIVYDYKREAHDYDAKQLGALLVQTIHDLKFALRHNEPRIIFRPLRINTVEVFEMFCITVMTCGKDYLLIFEEVNQLMTEKKRGEFSSKIIDIGRDPYKLGVVGICRRPVGLSQLLVSNVDNIFVSRMFNQNDLNPIKSWLPKDVYDRITDTPKYHFWHLNDENETVQLIDSYLNVAQGTQHAEKTPASDPIQGQEGKTPSQAQNEGEEKPEISRVDHQQPDPQPQEPAPGQPQE